MNKIITGTFLAGALLITPLLGLAQDTQTPPAETQVQPHEREENENFQEDYINPQEIQDTLRQLKDLKREIQRTLKRTAKIQNVANEVGELNSILADVNRFTESIKNTSSRDDLQEFYDSEIWDRFNSVRIKIELPSEIKMIEKDLAKLDRLMSGKTFTLEGVNTNIIRNKIQEIKDVINEARSSFNDGRYEDAREAMQIIHEGDSHPGEIMGIIYPLSDMAKRLKRMKPEVKAEFLELLQPVFEAANEGDFRGANQMMQEIQRSMWQLMDKAQKSRAVNPDFQNKIRDLEQKLQTKIQQIENQKNEPSPGPQSRLEVYKPYQEASLISAIAEKIRNLLGF